MRIARIVLVTASLAAAAVSGSAAAEPAGLTGTVWQVTRLLGKAPLQGTDLSSEFTPSGNVSGSAGCNHYGARFTQSGSSIRVSAITSTQMACPTRIMAQERLFLGALASARSYSLGGGKLTLEASGGRALVTYRAQSQQLAGTSWNVLAYNNGKQGVESVSAATKLTAVFAKDGNLSGFAGCNDYAATYAVAAPKISITRVSSTRKECATPKGVMDQELRYLAALSTAATYRIEGSKLELRTAAGAVAAEFQRK